MCYLAVLQFVLMYAYHCSSLILLILIGQKGSMIPLTPELRQHYDEVVRTMSGKALRCLAVAGKLDLGPLSDYDGPKHPSHKYVFLLSLICH